MNKNSQDVSESMEVIDSWHNDILYISSRQKDKFSFYNELRK